MAKRIIIFGATEMARMLHFYFTYDSPHDVVAFTVDGEFLTSDNMCGLPVVPFEKIDLLYPPEEYAMCVAAFFGRVNETRALMYGRAKVKGYQLISYVCSKASTWPDLMIGENSVITEGSVIGPHVEIGKNVVIAGGFIGHDSVIEDDCFVAANSVVLGNTTVEKRSFLGANSTILEKVVIGAESIIGAGATIAVSTSKRAVYIGKSSELLPKPSNVMARWLTWPVR